MGKTSTMHLSLHLCSWMDILGAVTRLPALVFGVERYDDDFADRLSYKYTVAILVIFAIIVTNRQFGTKQIQCWVPAQFTRNYEEYVNDICWVSNTYYIPVDQKLPKDSIERRKYEIRYYQWVPFILLLQAFSFYLPHIAWRTLSRRSGIDIKDLVEAAASYKSVEKFEKRKTLMNYLVSTIDQYVDDPRINCDQLMYFTGNSSKSNIRFRLLLFFGCRPDKPSNSC
ncbi:hypothetical protein ACOME3_001304 [Neoechinorhynchus agilis]